MKIHRAAVYIIKDERVIAVMDCPIIQEQNNMIHANLSLLPIGNHHHHHSQDILLYMTFMGRQSTAIDSLGKYQSTLHDQIK